MGTDTTVGESRRIDPTGTDEHERKVDRRRDFGFTRKIFTSKLTVRTPIVKKNHQKVPRVLFLS